MKKDKEKKNRKKDKENGSGSGEAGNHDNIDAPEAVVGFIGLFMVPVVRLYLCNELFHNRKRSLPGVLVLLVRYTRVLVVTGTLNQPALTL